MNKSIEVFNIDGDQIEIDDVQRINLKCFKCENYIEDNFGMLVSPSTLRSSDSVSTRKTIEVCENCYHEIMKFCGSVVDY